MDMRDYAKQLQSLGLSVYMRKQSDSYAYFTDGAKIGYIQLIHDYGASFSMVHKPNRISGTGFGGTNDIGQSCYSVLTIDNVNYAFQFAPDWADKRTRDSVVKFKDIQEFLNYSKSNSEFKNMMEN